MDIITVGLPAIATWGNVTAIILGCMIGLWSGALPGLSGVSATAIILPLTYGMDPLTALVLLTSIHTSAEFGGAISSILMNVPGESSAAAAAFDGYPMARQGKAGVALGVSSMSSLIGAFFGTIVVVTAAKPLISIVVTFGPSEYFALAVLGLTIVSLVSSGSVIKGFVMSLLGMSIGFVGLDPVLGVSRFTFGFSSLQGGIGFIPVITGLFAISELIVMVMRGGAVAEQGRLTGHLWQGVRETFNYPGAIIKSFLIGTGLGMMPGIGATATNFLAYSIVQRTSRHPETFGKGNPEGVIAPEVANNACIHAALIPALTMGIPAGASSALLIVVMTVQGIRPGAMLFQSGGTLINGLYAGLFLNAICSFLLMTVLIRVFARVTIVRMEFLAPTLLVLSIIAAYASEQSFFDMIAAVVFGFIGYLMRLRGLPIVNLMIGFVLGKLMETSFSQTLMMAGGSYELFYQRPVTLSIFAFTLAVATLTLLSRARSAAPERAH